MCGVCGCGEGETRIEPGDGRKPEGAHKNHAHDHDHHHDHEHDHHHHDDDHHHHDHDHEHSHEEGKSRIVKIEQDLLAKNDAYAAANRALFNISGVLALNLVSSPGSGKTTLLVDTIKRLQSDLPVAVIEGDQQTTMDAERIRATGAPALQINTGKGCHLDAHMTGHAFEQLRPAFGSVLFIENVGNLVCPAMFDLGEEHRVVLVSVTEGEDKPLKYPDMIRSSQLLLITKVDLLPHLDFNVDELAANARKINPGIKILKVSAKTGEGMDAWTGFIRAARALALTGCASVEDNG
jgi:hydrogenase nickel incorporation protein HypB